MPIAMLTPVLRNSVLYKVGLMVYKPAMQPLINAPNKIAKINATDKMAAAGTNTQMATVDKSVNAINT